MTSPPPRTRLALFGAGVIGRTHIDRIQRNPLLALAGIADPSDAAHDLAGTLGVPWFADHRSLLDATRPQGAVVATPNPLHVPMALDCLERGVAALVEKPVTDALDAGLALVAAQRTHWRTGAGGPAPALQPDQPPRPRAGAGRCGWAGWSRPM
jgi:predicted dehydrogenase